MARQVALTFLALKHSVFTLHVLLTFGLGAFFGYFGLLVFLEFYETQRPKSQTENRGNVQRVINRCALWGAFVIGLISLGFYLSR